MFFNFHFNLMCRDKIGTLVDIGEDVRFWGTDSTYKLELSGLNIANIPFPVSTKVLFVCTDKSIFALLSKVWFQSITLITKILKLVTVCVWKYNTGLLFQVVKKVFATTNNRAVDIDNWKIELGGMILILNIFQSFKKTLCN